jgi:hypothetical protein
MRLVILLLGLLGGLVLVGMLVAPYQPGLRGWYLQNACPYLDQFSQDICTARSRAGRHSTVNVGRAKAVAVSRGVVDGDASLDHLFAPQLQVGEAIRCVCLDQALSHRPIQKSQGGLPWQPSSRGRAGARACCRLN